MTTRALSADTARTTALEECETKIRSAFRRTLTATCEIAKELGKILNGELYKSRTADFAEYVTDYLHISRQTYDRIIVVSQTVALLQEAGLELPANESQVAELARLQAPLRTKIWNELLNRFEFEEKKITADDVRHAVETAAKTLKTITTTTTTTTRDEVEVEMDSDNGDEPLARKSKTQVQDAELILSEKGEAALARIRKVCGKEIAQAIADGTRAMTEKDIKAWAEYDDAMMRVLVYYVIDQGWTLNKAVAFETKEIAAGTDVHDLIMIASARGGSAQVTFDQAKITIKLDT